MDGEGIRAAEAWRIRGAAPPGTESGPSRPGASGSRFEELLGKVATEVENLKKEAAGVSTHLDAEGIRKPEELQAAFLEADRKYKSAMSLGRNLVKAYEAIKDR